MQPLSSYSLSSSENVYLKKLVSDLKNLNSDRALLIHMYAKEILQIHLVEDLIQAREQLAEQSNSILFEAYNAVRIGFIHHLESKTSQENLDPWRKLALESKDKNKGISLSKISWHIRDVVCASHLILTYKFTEAMESLKKDVATLNKKMQRKYLLLLGDVAEEDEVIFLKNELLNLEKKLQKENTDKALKVCRSLQDKLLRLNEICQNSLKASAMSRKSLSFFLKKIPLLKNFYHN